jgi:hypothetical protein
MMVLPWRMSLIVVMVLFEVKLVYELQLLEQAQAAIDSGQAEAGLLLPGPAVKLVGIQVPPCLLDEVQKQASLGGASPSRPA